MNLDDKFEVTNELHAQAKHERRLGLAARPEGVAQEFNREIRRRIDRELRKKAAEDAKRSHVIRVPKPIGTRSALDKVVDMLVTSPGGMYRSTIETLAKELPSTDARLLVESYDKQADLPRHLIREALSRIHGRGEAARRAARKRAGSRQLAKG